MLATNAQGSVGSCQGPTPEPHASPYPYFLWFYESRNDAFAELDGDHADGPRVGADVMLRCGSIQDLPPSPRDGDALYLGRHPALQLERRHLS
jgi:hypothetical protein